MPKEPYRNLAEERRERTFLKKLALTAPEKLLKYCMPRLSSTLLSERNSDTGPK